MKRKIQVILSCVLLVLASGCGSKISVDETTLAVQKDGSMVLTIIEDFDKDYYNIEELKEMNQLEVGQYNASIGEDVVEIKSMEVEEEQITVVMDYNNSTSYSGLNGKEVFFGTIEEAYDAGYDFDVTLTSAESSVRVIGKNEILQMSDYYILILDEALQVQTFKDILYFSEGISLAGDEKLATVTGETLSYIVFK